MDRDWILLSKETRRLFASASWVPLRASQHSEGGSDVTHIGYTSDSFACGSVAISPEHRSAGDHLGWSEIGIGHNVLPYAYEDGHYSPIDEYQYRDKEPIGVELVFEHPQPVVGGSNWILNPDLVVALRLIKEGSQWVRPEEDFIVVAREFIGTDGRHSLLEIRREFLADYLAARGLSLRMSHYRQRVENVSSTKVPDGLVSTNLERDGGRFSLSVRPLEDIFGGKWAMLRSWRTDFDDEEDAPVLGPERDDNVASESSRGRRTGYDGVRIEGEFWRDEWIDHNEISVRVRGDKEKDLPTFVVNTDGSRMSSGDLVSEDIGRWLWFGPNVVNELLSRRGFSLEWFTAETAGLRSTSGYRTHIGLNASDLVTVYASDIARLAVWEQRIWAAHNLAPDGKVSKELLDAQVRAEPAATEAVEVKLFKAIIALEAGFREEMGSRLFIHELSEDAFASHISRFSSTDLPSLLRLAKELVRTFTDRLDVGALRALVTRTDKDKLGSNKLLESVLSSKIGEEKARAIFGSIVGAYEMRIGDAHPTSSKVADALKLAGIDQRRSFLRQGEQLIGNFGRSIYGIGRSLFGSSRQ